MPAVFRSVIVLSLVSMFTAGSTAEAANPQLHAVFPFSCQSGTSVEVVLTGNDELKSATSLVFSHGGIRAERLDGNRFRITVAPEVPARDYDMWAVTPDAVSNARRFVISDIAEFVERDSNNDRDSAHELPLPAAVSGKIGRGPETDWYSFRADAGMAVTIACRSRSLDGSVAPALTVFGPDGRELCHSLGHRPEPILHLTAPESGTYSVRIVDRAYRNDPSSVYRLIVTSGPYVISGFPHVLAKGKRQNVTLYGFQLPGGESHASDTWRGLQSLTVDVDAPTAGDPDGGGWVLSPAVRLDGFRFRQPQIEGTLRLGLSEDVIVAETDGSNDHRGDAAVIPVPCRIVGRFFERGDVDWYRFTAKKGQSLVVEAFGERLGRPMDMDVSIHDANGKLLTTLKDVSAPKGFPAELPLDSLDAQGVWKAPADGDYALVVRDLYGGSVFGPDRQYEVTIGPSRPTFGVFASPPQADESFGLPIPRGGVGVLKMVVLRSGGFDQSVRIRPKKLPDGIQASDCWIGPGQQEALLALKASEERTQELPPLGQFVAEGRLEDATITVPVRSTTFTNSGQPPVRFTEGTPLPVGEAALLRMRLSAEDKIIAAGSPLRVRVQAMPRGERDGPIEFQWRSLPADMKVPSGKIASTEDATYAELKIPEKLQPGRYTLLVSATGRVIPESKASATVQEGEVEATSTKDSGREPVQSEAWSNGLSFEVADAKVAVAAKPSALTIAPGESVEVTVELKRADKSQGDWMVALDVPPEQAGRLQADPVRVASDAKSAVLKVRVPAEAESGDVDSAAISVWSPDDERQVVTRLPITASIRAADES